MASQRINTSRLALVSVSSEMARASAAGEHSRLAELLDAHVPPNWPPPIMADAQDALVRIIEGNTWRPGGLAWYIVHAKKHMLIGFAGFKGAPAEGRIDIGYALMDAYLGQGFATEAVMALVYWAFVDSRVQCIVSETLPDLIASKRVLEKCGFRLVAEGALGREGDENVCRYEIRREQIFG